MKNSIFQIIAYFLIGLGVFFSFYILTPHPEFDKKISSDKFSTQNAFQHVKKIAQVPHYVGSADHSKVRNYIVEQFQKLGLSVHTQNAYVINANGVMTNPTNIITKLKGSNPQPGSDLLVLAHYDSAPHSSFGASDDGAAVAAILESVRVFLAQKASPKNNIIFCITDAEEIGLLGAQLFAEQHPWMKNVGLVINFEARGTSGPANTIIETNHGNANLVKNLAAARPAHPMASSLMYEIYKNMPNDTDATVFREEKDIPSLFFAFIGSHYNYHAATDIPQNLAPESLAHLGSYLNALLPYLGNQDLTKIKTSKEQVYFNFPGVNIVHYSQALIIPLLILGWILLIAIFIVGFRYNGFKLKLILKGFIPFLLSLILCYIIGYYGWQLILQFNPQYLEIQQGFPYNGNTYIAAFVLLALAVLFGVYHYYSKSNYRKFVAIAPFFLWMLVNTGLAFYFRGASYFIIPVILSEIAYLFSLYQKKGNLWLSLILCLPAVFIFAPLVFYIPVALGIKIIFAGMLLVGLIFVLFLPVYAGFKHHNILAISCFICGLVFMVIAQKNSDFTSKHPKPNSLVYIVDEDQQKATWNTYDYILDDWTGQFIKPEDKVETTASVMGSKYGEGFTYTASAKYQSIPFSKTFAKTDTLNDEVYYEVKILPEAATNILLLYTNKAGEIEDLTVNHIKIKDFKNFHSKISRQKRTQKTRLLTYFPTDQDSLRVRFKSEKATKGLELEIYEASNNLLNNPWVKVNPRADTMMPRPFVLNDAIVVKHKVFFDIRKIK